MSAGSSTFQIRSADGAAALLLCLAGSSKYNGREQRNLKVIYFLTGLDGLVNSNHPSRPKGVASSDGRTLSGWNGRCEKSGPQVVLVMQKSLKIQGPQRNIC